MTDLQTIDRGPEVGLPQTEFAFRLPMGFLDDSGQLHRDGTIRLARARDEIVLLRDVRVRDNEAYLTVLLLARTVTRLGTLGSVDPSTIEGLFAADLAYLQDLYRRINADGHSNVAVTCPSCHADYEVDVAGDVSGES